MYKVVMEKTAMRALSPIHTLTFLGSHISDPITVKTLLWRMKNNMKLRETATFGLLPGSTKPQPSKFLRKHSKEPNLTVKRTTSSSLPVFPPLGAQTLILSAKFNLTMPFYQRFLFFILIVHLCTIATDRCTSKKAPLPDLTNQPPRYGIKSDTDYIYSNAERVIKASKIEPYLDINGLFL
uniref:Uncharacterized protein n=1 Tax=Physcomitrium patens TaxID=3218 RepID=A0A2K1L0H4_PHYPA|nr:hypothetical protein PHYPA_002313 [Physcomitrium patens]